MSTFREDMEKTNLTKAIEAIQPKLVDLKFPKDEKLVLYELYDNRLEIYCGWMIIHYNRARLEMYSISFNKDNEILITDSTKDGPDAMRIITDYIDYDNFLSISFHRDDLSQKICFKIETMNHERDIVLNIPYWNNLYKMLYNKDDIRDIIFLGDPENQ